AAADMLKEINGGGGRLGIEVGFTPIDAYQVLEEQLPDATLTDATFTLELLRARKTPDDLTLLREASEEVVDAMLAVIGSHGPGVTKRALFEALRQEETKRGLKFEYALTNIGTAFNRAPYDKI